MATATAQELVLPGLMLVEDVPVRLTVKAGRKRVPSATRAAVQTHSLNLLEKCQAVSGGVSGDAVLVCAKRAAGLGLLSALVSQA